MKSKQIEKSLYENILLIARVMGYNDLKYTNAYQ